MQDRPDKLSLLTAVAQLLSKQVAPAVEDRALRFRVLIAANVVGVVAREIATDGNGKATDLIYIDKRTRQEQRLRCRVLVLAASACESARILLNSKTSEFPNGVANSSGVVGRYLMDTVGYGLSGRIPSFEGVEKWPDARRASLLE